MDLGLLIHLTIYHCSLGDNQLLMNNLFIFLMMNYGNVTLGEMYYGLCFHLSLLPALE